MPANPDPRDSLESLARAATPELPSDYRVVNHPVQIELAVCKGRVADLGKERDGLRKANELLTKGMESQEELRADEKQKLRQAEAAVAGLRAEIEAAKKTQPPKFHCVPGWSND